MITPKPTEIVEAPVGEPKRKGLHQGIRGWCSDLTPDDLPRVYTKMGIFFAGVVVGVTYMALMVWWRLSSLCA